jgi:hypothetical protein
MELQNLAPHQSLPSSALSRRPSLNLYPPHFGLSEELLRITLPTWRSYDCYMTHQDNGNCVKHLGWIGIVDRKSYSNTHENEGRPSTYGIISWVATDIQWTSRWRRRRLRRYSQETDTWPGPYTAYSWFGLLFSRLVWSACGWKFLGELQMLKLADQWQQTLAGREAQRYLSKFVRKYSENCCNFYENSSTVPTSTQWSL